MPITISFEFGDVVLVPFPFTDQTTTKQRPAVVISSEDYHRERPDIILLAITSQQRLTSNSFDVGVQDWQGAGLLKPSVFKPLVATIERTLVLRRLGKLDPGDQRGLSDLLGKMLGA
jgi:mRNA interferase MazF